MEVGHFYILLLTTAQLYLCVSSETKEFSRTPRFGFHDSFRLLKPEASRRFITGYKANDGITSSQFLQLQLQTLTADVGKLHSALKGKCDSAVCDSLTSRIDDLEEDVSASKVMILRLKMLLNRVITLLDPCGIFIDEILLFGGGGGGGPGGGGGGPGGGGGGPHGGGGGPFGGGGPDRFTVQRLRDYLIRGKVAREGRGAVDPAAEEPAGGEEPNTGAGETNGDPNGENLVGESLAGFGPGRPGGGRPPPIPSRCRSAFPSD